MINTFEDDNAYISAKWLMNLIRLRGLRVKHLIRVIHRATKASHYVVLLCDGRYLCDCCMDANLGLVCRHFFVLWITIQDLPFHLSLIRPRCVASSWYSIRTDKIIAGIRTLALTSLVFRPLRASTISNQSTYSSSYAPSLVLRPLASNRPKRFPAPRRPPRKRTMRLKPSRHGRYSTRYRLQYAQL